MDVTNISLDVSVTYTQTKISYGNQANGQNQTNAANAQTSDQDLLSAVYDKTNANTPYQVNQEDVQKLLDESNKQRDAFADMIKKILWKQANANSAINTGSMFTYDFMQKVAAAADQETIDWAKDAISEDGYWGVKQTSERIVNFAKALTGGDPSKVPSMRDAVEQGFKIAEQMWGDKLPDISQKTYDAVMSLFDEWTNPAAANGSGDAASA